MNIRRYFVVSTFCWSLFVLLVVGYESQKTIRDSKKLAVVMVQTSLAKDMLYRSWVLSKGGVYAAVARNTPPNPSLAGIPEQNIETPSGIKLTLVNPSYMIRQVYDMGEGKKGARSHITSLNPIGLQNTADTWEKMVLQKFERGLEEYYEEQDINGEPFLRYMKVFTVQQGCLKCHAEQGYKKGDVRGGICISTPMTDSKRIEKSRLMGSYCAYFLLWFLGLGGLSYGSYHIQKQLNKQKETELELFKFKQTLDQTVDCVFMFASDTLQFIYLNQGAMDQVGYEEEELKNMTPVHLKPLLNEQSFRKLIEPLLEKPGKPITFETLHRHKDGHDIPVEIKLQYVILNDEQNRFVAIVRDISRQKEAEAEKEMLQSQMLHSQKLESVGQLAAGIAHEINTPAQFLGTNMEFLNESFQDVESLIKEYQCLVQAVKDGKMSPEMMSSLEQSVEELDWEYLADEIPLTIKQSREGVDRISKIVRAMKEFSHPGNKDKALVNINDIINTTITVASNEWKYVAELETDLAGDLPSISCLADEMGQVFLNILVNAAQAIAEKLGENPEGEKGLIQINSRLDREWVEVCINDNGQGMPGSVKEHIFDPFFTTKEVGKGTGQGLAIAHSVVTDKHQGTLSCESEEGVGTSFIIRLPRV